MRVVRLDLADPEFPASLADVDDPPLPRADWARIEVSGGGICGSDLHIFQPTTGPTPALVAYGTLPMEMGHEIAGTVVEAGTDSPVEVGARVAIDPVIGCAARGIDPVCDRCAAGAASVCHHRGSGDVTPGMGLGFTNGLGGGWGERVVAHHTQLHRLPDAVEARAETLVEPLSIGLHGLLRTPPVDGPVLVVGAGIIGLLATVALRTLFPELPVVVVAKHPHQADAARRCGASQVVPLPDEPGALYAALADAAGPDVEVRGSGADAILADGYPYVVEAVGSESSVTQALRSVGSRGRVLLLGAAGISRVDLTPLWFKEASMAGSFVHAHDRLPGPGGATVHTFDQAIEILAGERVPVDALVTHEYPLDDYRTAIETAMDRARGAIKVVLRP